MDFHLSNIFGASGHRVLGIAYARIDVAAGCEAESNMGNFEWRSRVR